MLCSNDLEQIMVHGTPTTEATAASKTANLTMPAGAEGHALVLFDGVCGLCNHSVNFIIDHDKRDYFRFAPLQGEVAARFLPLEEREALKSMVVIENGNIYRRSTAAVRILNGLGGHYKFFGRLLWLIPKPLRDIGYGTVAGLRYKIWGKTDACRMPTPEDREKFLE